MKFHNTLVGFITACFLILHSLGAFAQHTKEDIAAITTTLNYYIEGGTNRDAATFAKAFLPEGQMLGMMSNDSVRIVSLRDFVAGMTPGEKLKRTCRITNIQVYGNAASARLELVYDTHTFIDFMNLLKTKDGWKIVNKIYYREDKPKEDKSKEMAKTQ